MKRCRVMVHGVVQGVGFRPHVHRLAQQLEITGSIKNTVLGVEIECQGERLAQFIERIKSDAPPLARVQEVQVSDIPVKLFEREFVIQKSDAPQNAQIKTLIPPDVALCEACRRELFTKGDRRYNCAFINCTDCGPRFTIISGIPYDRAMTSMGKFTMCEHCEAEFHDITSRRYHAQPVCCNECAPRYSLCDFEGREIGGDPIKRARTALENGKIVAIKGIGGFHLACLADEATVSRLRERKHRDEKPLALMCPNIEAARRYGELSQEDERLLRSFSAPIVLAKKRAGLDFISENAHIGIVLAYAPVHELLFHDAAFDALVMTSANDSDMPLCRDNDEAIVNLGSIAQLCLLNNRDIVNRCDDSLVYQFMGHEYFVRRSRGYVPYPIALKRSVPQVLACGALQKASFCITQDKYAFPSAHIGDLSSIETLVHYKQQVAHFQRLFEPKIEMVACDMHPDYMSSRFAKDFANEHGLPLVRVQHHHAHMASCMADNGLCGEVIGVIWDGTGLGLDGSVWGGEFLVGGYGSFERMGSISPFFLPGGDLAAKDCERAASGALFGAGAKVENKMHAIQLEKGINCPITTSVGRLFDAVSFMLGICGENTYQARAAMLLQAAAQDAVHAVEYSAKIVQKGQMSILNTDEMLCALQSDAKAKAAESIALGFHEYLARGACLMCEQIRERTGHNRVVLSGGVFLNTLLLEKLMTALQASDFEVYCHRNVSSGDEGLSLGQAMVAAHINSEKEGN